MADAAGNCTATPVDLTAGATYKIAQNDFTATGGDGYPNFASRMTTQDIMEQVTADYITAHSPLTPVVKAAPNGRINCTDSNGAGRRRTVRRWFRLRSDEGWVARRVRRWATHSPNRASSATERATASDGQ